MLSSGTTNIDSVTRFGDYIEQAKKDGLYNVTISEHGNIYEWYHKKQAIEAAGFKYIHAVEAYITENPDEKVRDNYHCLLFARNYEGFKELNRLISASYNRATVKCYGDKEQFYYTPRILFDELINTSDNIIISTACMAGILCKGNNDIRKRFLQFIINNKERCFLEVQHHQCATQGEYNKYLARIAKKYGLQLLACTDTHSLDERHKKGRSILQKSKNVFFDNEEEWDLTYKTYDELVDAFKKQGALTEEEYMSAIRNTNKLVDMVEEFTLDTNTKYPAIYENPLETYKSKINDAYKNHKYLKDRYSKEEYKTVIDNELGVYEKTKSIDFMLLQTFMREWERENNIECGYGRGSVSGSEIAYTLGITQMDSMKFGLNFFRFMNPDRVTNADIDTDYSSEDREKVKYFLLHDHMNLPQIQSAEIITFNTIAMKGAIKDVCRALYKEADIRSKLSPKWQKRYDSYMESCDYYNGQGQSVSMPKDLQEEIERNTISHIKIAEQIIKELEINEETTREKYPEVFEYVDIIVGTVVSVGTHPSGVLISDKNLFEEIGLCSLSTSNYPVSMLNMKELDALMYVKLDILGLDNIGIINETCRMLGIERLTPDNTDLEDEDVWKSIRDDTTMIFQWESESAQAYLKKFMSDETIAKAKEINDNFSYIKWFSFGNGLIRPGCASFRDDVANGNHIVTGFKELDEFLAVTFGRVVMQEDIMQFLVKFCGYSDAESDTVRRGIAKKYGTEKFIDEIHDRFLDYSHKTYGVSTELLEEIFPPIKQGILDATYYAFSWNHSDSYSCIGYVCGYLRYYHPVEFITAALNTFQDKEEKTVAITEYAKKNNVEIKPIKFRFSQAKYSCNGEEIYKGIASIKFLNAQIADELYELGKNKYDNFLDLLLAMKDISINSKQLTILIKLDFFSEFGEINTLLKQYELFGNIYGKKQFKVDKLEELEIPVHIIMEHAKKQTDKLFKDFDSMELLKAIVKEYQYPKTSIVDKIKYQQEFYGYIQLTIPTIGEQYAYVQTIDGVRKKTVSLYRLKTGEIEVVRIRQKQFDESPINVGDIIKTIESSQEKKWGKDKETGEFYQKDEYETILKKWSFAR